MAAVSKKENVFSQYLTWHFAEQPRFILTIWKNLLHYNLNFFSISLLFRTLFSHWRRYHISYGRGVDLRRYFEAFTFNVISRGLGAVVRTIFIVIGLIIELFILLGGGLVLLAWILLPVLMLIGLIFGAILVL